MIKYHHTNCNIIVAEITDVPVPIDTADTILDIMAEVGYHKCSRMIMYDRNLSRDFFDLKTGVAGEILQKFSNYRMKLAIVGDYSGFTSKSLKDFIRESNRQKTILFVNSFDEAMALLSD